MTKQRDNSRLENPLGRPRDEDGSPFAPNTDGDVEAMLTAIGTHSIEDLFDIPDPVRFDGQFGLESAPEQQVVQELTGVLSQNESRKEFLGRKHYSHYIPSIVDHLSLRSEYITSYTQYQPEVTQGFLQVLFEYQSLLVELTGLGVANCSMYDAATALGEAATLADRVRQVEGHRILVPEYMRQEYHDVLKNYIAGSDLEIEMVATTDGMVDLAELETSLTNDVVMVYAENPTVDGVIEENLTEIGTLVDEHDALFCLGSDIVALSLLEQPSAVGADIVVGDASVLGLPAAHGMGLGIFACDEGFLRQVPGRLVGISEEEDGSRAYTLTLQTREQHIRRERATSNICTNQAWLALRAAIHAAYLGPSGLVSLAEESHRLAEELASELNCIDGITSPVRDCHHFREFKAHVESDGRELAAQLGRKGFAIHALSADEIQICVTDVTEPHTDELVCAINEVLN